MTHGKTQWIAGAVHPSKAGTFTAYCGGTVTQACIDKGMHSKNKTTRARARFAQAMRHGVHHGRRK